MSAVISSKAPAAPQVNPAVADRLRPLDAVEMEWKQRIFTRLLTVLDLTMMASVPEAQARQQIREVTMRLLVEESAPLSLAQRQHIVRQIEDEVLGMARSSRCWPIRRSPTFSSTARTRCSSSGAASSRRRACASTTMRT